MLRKTLALLLLLGAATAQDGSEREPADIVDNPEDVIYEPEEGP